MKNTHRTSSSAASTFPVLSAMGFAALGLFSFGLACVLILLRPDTLGGDPVRGPVLALTHLVTLGWIGSLLFAGAYLVGPVLAGGPLWSARLPCFHLVCHATGLAVMLGGLALLRYDVASAGALVLVLGLLGLIFNLIQTASARSLWTPSNLAFQASLFWLAVTGGVALLMLRGRVTGSGMFAPETLIALHAHFALFGFLAQALLGVSLKILPDLLGSGTPKVALDRLGWAGWGMLNTGLLALFPAAILGSDRALFVVGILIALGVIGFALQIGAVLWLARTKLNWGAATLATGIFLLALIAAGALWRFPQVTAGEPEVLREWMRLYISLALLGPFAFAILGTGAMLLPRLIWRLRFAPWAAHAEVPSPAVLGRKGAGGPIYFSLLLSWGYLALGQITANPEAIRLGGLLLLVGFGWFLVGVAPALARLFLGVTPDDVGHITPSPSDPNPAA